MLSPGVSIERDADIQAAHIHTSTIKLRTLKGRYCSWLELFREEDTGVSVDGYYYMWMLGDVGQLTPQKIHISFCFAYFVLISVWIAFNFSLSAPGLPPKNMY